MALEGLGDGDARVRWASAKAVGRIAFRLPADMAEQVARAVLLPFAQETQPLSLCAANAAADAEAFFLAPSFSCLRSTAWAVQTAGGDGTAAAAAAAAEGARLDGAYKDGGGSEVLSASRERLWAGTVLAVAELLRQGLVERESLILALRFVCRSLFQAVDSGGVGGGSALSCRASSSICDGACYAAWAFARSYGRDALAAEPSLHTSLGRHLLLVLLFAADVCERRAAAAAYQEVEGRQGGLEKGLDVITTADFFLLSTRRASCLRAAPAVAALSPDVSLSSSSLHALLVSPTPSPNSDANCRQQPHKSPSSSQEARSPNAVPLAVVLLEYLCCRVYRHPDAAHRQLAAAAAARICVYARPYAANVSEESLSV